MNEQEMLFADWDRATVLVRVPARCVDEIVEVHELEVSIQQFADLIAEHLRASAFGQGEDSVTIYTYGAPPLPSMFTRRAQ